ncbi:hypothetical protein GP486_005184 [Trichoglossum hirsutum]|uniref:Uncharacterized protein n=1 Tax=Trichoglossum hirsutum TaxID=265104 RepID=A0A9P8L9Q7_9PEZI|nr:hypothetical protein GP486_005184 [Trichoglossum hirsutum]
MSGCRNVDESANPPGLRSSVPPPGDATTTTTILNASYDAMDGIQANGNPDDPSTLLHRSACTPSVPPHSCSSSAPEDDAHSDSTLEGSGQANKPSSLNDIDLNRDPVPVQKARTKEAVVATGSASPARFDPHLILDPRGHGKKRSSKELEEPNDPRSVSKNIVPTFHFPQNHADASTASDEQGEEAHGSGEDSGVGYGALIENLHGVRDRDGHPRKRLKQGHGDGEGDRKPKNGHFGGGGRGVVGEYMRDKRLEGQKEGAKGAAVVDLTADDDEEADEPVVTYDSGVVEVCYGALTKARVHAHMVPYPKQDSVRLDPSMWPAIKVQLKRRDGTNTHIISVFDGLGNDFGTIDTWTALALAPLMDAGVVRAQARILTRKKEPGETPGKSISGYYGLSLNLYGKRRDAQRIGKFLGQKNVWLQEPVGVDSGVSIEILHLAKAQPVVKLTPAQAYVTRTVEEIRNEVVGVFDSLHQSEKLPEMEADPRILTPLLSHQKQGLYFMTNKEKERVYDEKDEDGSSLWRLRVRANGQKSYYNVITGKEEKTRPPEILGGILADMMGLGKTLSILSLAVATLDDSNEWARRKPPPHKSTDRPALLRNSKTTLLVAPLSTISNWEEQIKTHIQPGTLTYYVYHGSNRLSDLNQLAKYDILITTYNVVSSEYGRRMNGTGNGVLSPLEHTNWFRIVLDEAHMIREQSTRQSQAVCELSAQRRWAVTGTPVQNRLEDLGALIKFLRIKPFDERKGFTEFILSPFKNANPEILPKLRLLVDSITLRRLKDRIDLPPRRDQIVRLEFSKDERALYEMFAKDSNNKMRVITTTQQNNNGLGSKAYAHVLRAILRLRLICAHGKDLLSEEDLKVTEGWSKHNAIDLSDDEEENSGLSPQQACEMYNLIKQANMDNCVSCDRKLASNDPMVDEAINSKDDVIGFMTHCYQMVCKDCVHGFRKRVHESTDPDKHLSCLLCGQWIRFSLFELKQRTVDEMEEKKLAASSNPRIAKQLGKYGGPHTKTKALIAGLLQSQAESNLNPSEPPIKSVVFSGWTSHLDLIQIALEDNGISYTRLDGKMSRTQRTAALETFKGDQSITVILVSLMAGGLGLNLTTASQVYVMEPQFNPAAEAQAVDRVHRLGQKRPVTTTRFIMSGSFEEKMLDLQRKKQNLADLSMNRERLDKKEAVKRKLEELRSLFK